MINKLRLVAEDYSKEEELDYLKKNKCPVCGSDHSFFFYTFIETSSAGVMTWDVHCTECNNYFKIDMILHSMYKIILKEVE